MKVISYFSIAEMKAFFKIKTPTELTAGVFYKY